MGKFRAKIEYNDRQIEEIVYVVDTPEGQKRCSLLSKSVAEKQGIITFHIAERAVYGIAKTRKGLSPKLQEVLEEYEDRFNGVGTLKDKRGKIKMC